MRIPANNTHLNFTLTFFICFFLTFARLYSFNTNLKKQNTIKTNKKKININNQKKQKKRNNNNAGSKIQ